MIKGNLWILGERPCEFIFRITAFWFVRRDRTSALTTARFWNATIIFAPTKSIYFTQRPAKFFCRPFCFWPGRAPSGPRLCPEDRPLFLNLGACASAGCKRFCRLCQQIRQSLAYSDTIRRNRRLTLPLLANWFGTSGLSLVERQSYEAKIQTLQTRCHWPLLCPGQSHEQTGKLGHFGSHRSVATPQRQKRGGLS